MNEDKIEGLIRLMKRVYERIKFYCKAASYVINLYSAIIIYKLFYRKPVKGLITMGSSNGKQMKMYLSYLNI